MFKKKKKNEIEEVLKNHSQSIQELQNQVKVLQHTLKYGENGVGVELYLYSDPLGLMHLAKIAATYIHGNKVYTVTDVVKKEIYDKYKRGTHKVDILLNNPKYIIFNLKINDRGVVWSYTYMIDKEIEAICEYPQVEAIKDE